MAKPVAPSDLVAAVATLATEASLLVEQPYLVNEKKTMAVEHERS
jgi:hypothetical protein